MITVKINNVDVSGMIPFGSLNISDNINRDVDVARFAIEPNSEYTPEVDQIVIIEKNGVRTYGGVVISVDQSISPTGQIRYDVDCKDFSHHLDRLVITERFQNTTAHDVVTDLIDVYGAQFGFTGTNVKGESINVASISFNGLYFTQCLDKLCNLTNYYWYVDYNKDIHFFRKNEEPAPFQLTDNNGNYIPYSLSIRSDFSQIRNKIKVRGGEGRAAIRTEKLTGDGEKDTFPLGNKFAELPAITVNGVVQTVGVDYLGSDADYDVMWNFQQKYIRFTPGNIPPAPGSGETNIEVTGIPLRPIVVQIQDPSSILKYGVYEFSERRDSLQTRDEALQYTQGKLTQYANSIREASFETYTPGLRSGQTITLNSSVRGVSEAFLIQKVVLRQITPEIEAYNVELATLRTMSIIDFLQTQLTQERLDEGEDETLLNFYQMSDSGSASDSLAAFVVTTSEDYVWENDIGDTYANPIRWNMFSWDD